MHIATTKPGGKIVLIGSWWANFHHGFTASRKESGLGSEQQFAG